MRKHLAVCLPGAAGKEDKCFSRSSDESFGGDSDSAMYVLCEEFAKLGIDCHTYDVLPLESFDGFLFYEMPSKDDEILSFARAHNKSAFLIVAENHFIWKANGDFSRYGEFDAVFSYNDDVVARGLARKLNYARIFALPKDSQPPFEDRKFACMVSSRVKKNRPHCVSWRRLETIKFYEMQHPELFDLYGIGWENGTFMAQERPAIYSVLSSLRLNKLLPKVYHPSWKGMIHGLKAPTLRNYRFVYCYENSIDIPGYITEKIFDVMMARAVPVYLGHPSTDTWIPKECYIDRAAFADDADLYEYMSKLSKADWIKYMDAGRNFMMSNKSKPFDTKTYVDTIISVIFPKVQKEV